MSRLVSDITLDQVDEWFKIGQTVYKDVHTLPRSTTSGRYFDPETQQPILVSDQPYVPHYHRSLMLELHLYKMTIVFKNKYLDKE